MASASVGHNIESPKSRKRVEIDFDKLSKELSDIDEGEGLTTQEVAEQMG
jgi:HSP90 family molecular chaperone